MAPSGTPAAYRTGLGERLQAETRRLGRIAGRLFALGAPCPPFPPAKRGAVGRRTHRIHLSLKSHERQRHFIFGAPARKHPRPGSVVFYPEREGERASKFLEFLLGLSSKLVGTIAEKSGFKHFSRGLLKT